MINKFEGVRVLDEKEVTFKKNKTDKKTEKNGLFSPAPLCLQERQKREAKTQAPNRPSPKKKSDQ